MNNNMQKMIDEAVEEFRKKLENEFTEPTGTQFECIDNNDELYIAHAEEFTIGTLIIIDEGEVFRVLEASDQKPWITFIGEEYTHSEFAKLMREQFVKPKIIHVGV